MSPVINGCMLQPERIQVKVAAKVGCRHSYRCAGLIATETFVFYNVQAWSTVINISSVSSALKSLLIVT